jgi:flagellum-specific ATP synthase
MEIREPMSTGVRAIDACLTLGKGQRIGLFGGSGIGKSTLLAMMAKNTHADVSVLALVGERGREVRAFIEDELGDALARSVVVVATSEYSPLLRIRAALAATAIAEHFREQGQHVLLMMDSLTRFAMAQREVGLAAGEPPTTKGYTPSVFSMLPSLVERAGLLADGGSITGVYTVLVEGDDMTDPVADAARSLLDGHIILSRSHADRGHFPAIDMPASLSRLMPAVVSPEQRDAATRLRAHLATLSAADDLIQIGAYKTGSNPEVDEAIAKRSSIESFLRQGLDEPSTYEDALAGLMGAIASEADGSQTT